MNYFTTGDLSPDGEGRGRFQHKNVGAMQSTGDASGFPVDDQDTDKSPFRFTRGSIFHNLSSSPAIQKSPKQR